MQVILARGTLRFNTWTISGEILAGAERPPHSVNVKTLPINSLIVGVFLTKIERFSELTSSTRKAPDAKCWVMEVSPAK